MARPDLDAIDLRILAVVQENSALSYQQISERIHLSLTPVWRRMKRLEEDGFIMRQVAILNAGKLGLALTAFVEVRLAATDPASVAHFIETVARYPEIVEIHRVSGAMDYLMKLRLRDMAAYEMLYDRLVAQIVFAESRTTFTTKEIRDFTALPLDSVLD